MKISGNTKVACLIGHPVNHSFSPYIHNYLAGKCGLDMKYVCFDVKEEDVKAALDGIRALGLIGCNVTIPHKIEVMKYLDEVDSNAALIGAVNCIKNESGKLIGYNTDGVGFVKSVRDAGHSLEGKVAMVLGAGGASRAVAVELAAAGINELIILNHTVEKAEALGAQIKSRFKELSIKTGPLSVTEASLEGVDFLVNTTPLGMSKQKDLSPVDEGIRPPKDLVVCDIVYTPHTTKLLSWAKAHGLEVVHGIGMLINQGVHGFYLWTGKEVDAYDEIVDLLKEQGVI